MPGTFDPNAIGFLYLRVGRPVKAALILPFALVALFCGGASESDEGSTERALWAEPVRAAAEFDRRLRGLFAYRQGFMVFVDPDPRSMRYRPQRPGLWRAISPVSASARDRRTPEPASISRSPRLR